MPLQRGFIFFLLLTPACRLTSGQANGAEQDADLSHLTDTYYRAVDVALESAEGEKTIIPLTTISSGGIGRDIACVGFKLQASSAACWITDCDSLVSKYCHA